MEALEFAGHGLHPLAGAYRNRTYAQSGVLKKCEIPRALEDIFYDPQTSGGLLIAVAENGAQACLRALQAELPNAAQIGYVTELHENYLILNIGKAPRTYRLCQKVFLMSSFSNF